MNQEKTIIYGAGRTLFKQGDADTELYFVLKGQIDLFIRDEGTGSQVLMGTIGEKAVLGTLSFLEGEPRNATAVTKTEVHLVKVTQVVRDRIFKGVPHWFGVLVKDMAETIRDLDRKYLIAVANIESLEKKLGGKEKQGEKHTLEIEKMTETTNELQTKNEELKKQIKSLEESLAKARDELTTAQNAAKRSAKRTRHAQRAVRAGSC